MADHLAAFADEHGVPALLDHLGLDGHANTLVEIRDHLARTEAERDRLRGALENIAYAGGEEPVTAGQLQDIAREALSRPEDERG
jgi:hypothetical protein